jgi:hypothetical protein
VIGVLMVGEYLGLRSMDVSAPGVRADLENVEVLDRKLVVIEPELGAY